MLPLIGCDLRQPSVMAAVPLQADLGDHASNNLAAWITGDDWRWRMPQKGHSIEAVSPSPRNSPETKLNLSSLNRQG
jgi:hypothetical protein